jgi:hypothetical protein
MQRLHWSARAYHRVLKAGRTVPTGPMRTPFKRSTLPKRSSTAVAGLNAED